MNWNSKSISGRKTEVRAALEGHPTRKGLTAHERGKTPKHLDSIPFADAVSVNPVWVAICPAAVSLPDRGTFLLRGIAGDPRSSSDEVNSILANLLLIRHLIGFVPT